LKVGVYAQDADFNQLMRQYVGTPETPDLMLNHYRQKRGVREPRKVTQCDVWRVTELLFNRVLLINLS